MLDGSVDYRIADDVWFVYGKAKLRRMFYVTWWNQGKRWGCRWEITGQRRDLLRTQFDSTNNHIPEGNE